MLKIVIKGNGEKQKSRQFVLCEPKVAPDTLAEFSQKVTDTVAEYFGEGSAEVVVMRRRKGSKVDVMLPVLMALGGALSAAVAEELGRALGKYLLKKREERDCCDGN